MDPQEPSSPNVPLDGHGHRNSAACPTERPGSARSLARSCSSDIALSSLRNRTASPPLAIALSLLSGSQFSVGNRSSPNLSAPIRTPTDDTVPPPLIESMQLTETAMSALRPAADTSHIRTSSGTLASDNSDVEVSFQGPGNASDTDDMMAYQSATDSLDSGSGSDYGEVFETVNINDSAPPSPNITLSDGPLIPPRHDTTDSSHLLSASAGSSTASFEGVRRMRSGSTSSTRSIPYSSADDALNALSLKSFRRWILCFCVVNFDLELGQAMELIYPPVNLSECQRKNICFSAFPDSNSKIHLGDSTFCFRIRASSEFPKSSSSNKSTADAAGPRDLTGPPPPLQISSTHDHDSFLHGYVFFRQQKDAEIRRGYFQKSLVLLTSHPWPGLMLRLMSVIGPTFMDALVDDRKTKMRKMSAARALLDTACHDVASWPPPPFFLSPQTGYSSTTLELPFSGTLLFFSIPPSNRPSDSKPASSSAAASLHSGYNQAEIACPAKLYRLFSSSLEMLWVCWELMIIGEPILVVADNPRCCSEVVWALIELIKPIAFGGDFRPYFTIQDDDFKTFANRSKTPSGATVLGVTNPVFGKVLEHWPNIIRVAKGLQYVHPPEIPAQGSDIVGIGRGYPIGYIPPKNVTHSPKMKPGVLGSERGSSVTLRRPELSYEALVASMPELTIESVTTKHKSFFSKDRKLIRSVAEAGIRGHPAHGLDNMLRRHFVELAERFLQPLNRHFEALVVGSPVRMTLSTLKSKPEIRPFKQDSFLKSVESSPPQLGLSARRPVVELYRQFLKSPNFASWLRGRIAEVNRIWRMKYLEVLTECNVSAWVTQQRMSAGGDVECIDLLMRIYGEMEMYETVWQLEDADSYVASASVTSLRGSTQHLRTFDEKNSSNNSTTNNGSNSNPNGGGGGGGANSGGRIKVVAGLIPTGSQYDRLVEAAKEVLEQLPPDLKKNFQDIVDANLLLLIAHPVHHADGPPKCVVYSTADEVQGIGSPDEHVVLKTPSDAAITFPTPSPSGVIGLMSVTSPTNHTGPPSTDEFTTTVIEGIFAGIGTAIVLGLALLGLSNIYERLARYRTRGSGRDQTGSADIGDERKV
ncbi:hypothetical protein SeMB42_g03146 [Synchytrium endobioticum]|uniref:UDENN domain-containing protein n=1 Tax=Synchytrium endobioticum TaxID=286115 RepID=A0A507DAR9_9FUNG|nr:hypothetical protein SeLEV6574_g03193 [Synchytrium endobioticum]TPX48000.1 hypothetical protein SeMB42_g03146 [Synchytrium endobioticum]